MTPTSVPSSRPDDNRSGPNRSFWAAHVDAHHRHDEHRRLRDEYRVLRETISRCDRRTA